MDHMQVTFAQAYNIWLTKTILGCTRVSYDIGMSVHVNIVVKDYIFL